MGSESDALPPEGQEALPVPIAPEGEEKPKRKFGKRAAPKPSTTLPTTEAGEKVADQLQRKLIDMLNATALTEANRRRATAIDTTDYEAGFGLIAGPPKKNKVVAIVADVIGAIGAALIGYATSVYTGGTKSDYYIHAHIAILSGIALLSASIVLKHTIGI